MNSKRLILKGLGTSPGVAQGKVRIVSGIGEASNFAEGEILVTRITDPTMVMMMNRAAAIVCDIGGITSHPSIISRELGIPCVVNTKVGTTRFKDGQKLIVNGTNGEIYLA